MERLGKILQRILRGHVPQRGARLNKMPEMFGVEILMAARVFV